MSWIQDFQFFLFDFDGLLVDTEKLHFHAYREMMERQGFSLNWDFTCYCKLAHLDAAAIREALYAEFPDLNPDWGTLYAEKKAMYLELIQAGQIRMMPGAQKLLLSLQRANIRRCVVTNSSLEQTLLIRSKLQVLNTIPHWVTREQYEKPKPSSECYLRAIQLYAQPGNRMIGFEDSVRGLTALQGTPALAVLICPFTHPLIEHASGDDVLHFESFDGIPEHSIG